MPTGIPPTRTTPPEEPAGATSAAEWKRDLPRAETLPSGNRAVLVRPQILRMVATGQIPNPLAEAALALAEGAAVAMDADEIATSIELMEVLVAASFVEPELFLGPREETPEGALHIDDLDDLDKAVVLARALGRALEFATFRKERAGARPGGDGRAVLDEALGDAGAE